MNSTARRAAAVSFCASAPPICPAGRTCCSAALPSHPRPLEERRFADFFGADVEEVVMPAGMTEV